MNLLFTLFISMAAAPAEVDPFNVFLWNKENIASENGEVDRGDWFEWWYFKVVDPSTRKAFFFTYGIVNPWDQNYSLKGTGAVIQFGDFQKHFLVTEKLPLRAFSAGRDQTFVRIAGNQATDKGLHGDLFTSDGHHIQWDLKMEKPWAFNAMGWTMRIPEISGIYWYPAQASALMSGWLMVDGVKHVLENAPAYQDRNWGRSFPKWWTWITSNHFKNSPGTVFAAGGGEPKIFNEIFGFAGLGMGLKYGGKVYVFRTPDLDKFDFNIKWGTWSIVAENSRAERIEISAYAPPGDFMELPFNSPRGGTFHDYEALLGHLTIKLSKFDYVKNKWRTIADLESDEAGIEWGSPEAIESMGLQNFSVQYN